MLEHRSEPKLEELKQLTMFENERRIRVRNRRIEAYKFRKSFNPKNKHKSKLYKQKKEFRKHLKIFER